MRFGIIQYDNGEIVSLSNLDKKLPKEKRAYKILEETTDASQLDRLLSKHKGEPVKVKIERDPVFGSYEYCVKNNYRYIGMSDKGKYCRLLRPTDTWDNRGILFNNYDDYVKWFYGKQ